MGNRKVIVIIVDKISALSKMHITKIAMIPIKTRVNPIHSSLWQLYFFIPKMFHLSDT